MHINVLIDTWTLHQNSRNVFGNGWLYVHFWDALPGIWETLLKYATTGWQARAEPALEICGALLWQPGGEGLAAAKGPQKLQDSDTMSSTCLSPWDIHAQKLCTFNIDQIHTYTQDAFSVQCPPNGTASWWPCPVTHTKPDVAVARAFVCVC